jgi:hypothetical protein
MAALTAGAIAVGTGAEATKAKNVISDLRRQPGPPAVLTLRRADLASVPTWRSAFGTCRKDARYYEVVEDTITGFEYRYFVLHDESGEARAVQPFFVHNQDLLAGVPWLGRAAFGVRRLWPGFLILRTLMVGCAAGEGRFDGHDDERALNARVLAGSILAHARALKTPLIVLKEFAAGDRPLFGPFLTRNFTRVPSMPMVAMRLNFGSFDEHLRRAVSRNGRYKLRAKFKKAAAGDAITMSVVTDIAPVADKIYQLYLNMYERATLRFEKLTKEFFLEVARRMPDKARFFVWRQKDRIIGFNLCMSSERKLCSEYAGMDYAVALDVHLYFVIMRDVIEWAIAHGYEEFLSTGLVYAPKHQLRFKLVPLDLYVRHTSPLINALLSRVLPYLAPTRHDLVLRRFENYAEL